MGKKHRIPEVETLSEESKRLYDVLNNESDLACVLIAASYLDYALASLLKRYFIESDIVSKLLDPPRGAISTFASRSDLAYCLGLIPKGLYQNLETIGKIRNTFAHSYLSLDLEHNEISGLVEQLIAPIIDHSITIDGDDVKRSGPAPLPLRGTVRDKFNTIAVLMVNSLLLAGLTAKHRERKARGWS
jgi:DNA-binding MltR family transcriptional regulator